MPVGQWIGISLLYLSVWWAIPAHAGEVIKRYLEAPQTSAEYKLGPNDPPVNVMLLNWHCTNNFGSQGRSEGVDRRCRKRFKEQC